MVCIGVKSQCVGFMRQGFTDLQPPKPCVPNKTLETTQCLCLNNHKDWLHNWDQISTDLVLFISTSSRNTCNLIFFYLWVWLNFWTSLPPSASLIWMLVTGWEGSRVTEAVAWASLAAWSCWEVGGAEINSGVALERKGQKKPKHDQSEQKLWMQNIHNVYFKYMNVHIWRIK